MDRSGTVQAEALTTTGTYIREVILENFMSHEYSRIKLKRGVNIITGPNGSGKSSILLGIAVALGQTYTERAEKLSDLIQRGKDTARVTVIFDNSPINDKRPVRSITSDTIAITRYIKKSGEYWHYVNNRFRTKAEVDQLLKNIGINPNNMLIIMHQNMIENFASRNNIEKLQMVEDAVGISLLRERIVEAEARLRTLMSETNNIKKLLSEAEASVDYWRSELEKLTKIRQLESIRKKLEQEYAWCLVKRIEDDLDRKTKIREKLYGENEQLRIEIENLISEMLEKKEKIKNGIEERIPITDILRFIDELIELASKQGAARLREKQIKEELGEIDRDISRLQSELNESLRQAAEKGERILSNRDPHEVLEDIRLTTLQIASIGSVSPEAENMYLIADAKFSEIKARAEEMYENIKRSMEEVSKRKEIWRNKLREIVSKVEPTFQEILATIGAKGAIILRDLEDLSTASIELHVGFRGNDPTILDSHTHSGGERVVATLAFLLALQSHMKSSFRAVDEFDVHLDPLNREMMMKILLATANKYPETQYLLITPSRVQVSKEMNIIVVQNVSGRSFIIHEDEAE